MDFGPILFLATLEGALQASILALTAVGLSLVFGVMRIVNVAHGEFYMLGAVLAWWSANLIDGSPALGFLVALVLSPILVGAIALIADRAILSRLEYRPQATIVATIGLLYILQQSVLSLYGPDARPVVAPFDFRVQFPWFGYSGYRLMVIVASAAILATLWAVMNRSRYGLIMRATQFDRETARAFGVPVGRVFAAVFAVGAMLAALAAVLIVPVQQAYYLMGLDPLLLSFVVVILGGLGSLKGTVIAAILIGMADGMASVFFEPTLGKILATVFVALVLIYKPTGLFGEEEA
ncbi:MAG: branched-chain amino acid ABC transporter permease [Alphaproteobacteria bacterium]